MITKRRTALTLVEVMVASLVLMIALPAIIQAAMSMAQWDRARDLRSHATHFGQAAMERARWHLYNDDTRRWRLTDTDAARRAGYARTPPSWMEELLAQAAPSGAVVDAPSAGAAVSRPFGEMFARNPSALYPWAGLPPPPPPGGLTSATNPELIADVGSYRAVVSAAPHVVTTDPVLAIKAPAAAKADLARLDVTITWTDFRGQQREQRIGAYVTRPVGEPDWATSTVGGN